MALSLKVRCTNCNETFQNPPGTTCAVCSATTFWEPCVHDSNPGPTVNGIHRHPSGVAFFAYEEAAKVGLPAPAWALPLIPANSESALAAIRELDLGQAVATLRQWAADARNAPTATNGNVVTQFEVVKDRLGTFFDRFADLLISLNKQE